jgi:hypothetical protein
VTSGEKARSLPFQRVASSVWVTPPWSMVVVKIATSVAALRRNGCREGEENHRFATIWRPNQTEPILSRY